MPLFGPPDVAQLKAKRDVQGLIKALGYSGDTGVRRAAAEALGEVGDPRAVDPLIIALKNPDWERDWHDTAALAEALVRLGAPSIGPLIAALDWHSKVVRVTAAGALASIGRPVVQPLVRLLGDADLETRETAGEILADIGAEAIDDLIAALSDEMIGRRQRAAKVLGDIGDPRAVDALARALMDPLAGVRQTAAKSLGEIADARAAGSLAAVLADPDLNVRRAAALALAEMRDPRAIPVLLHELRGAKSDPVVDGLARIGVPATEPMLAMLADSRARGDEPYVVDELRSEVTAILGKIGYPQDVATLVTQLFAEEDAERSRAAAELIRRYQSEGLDGQVRTLILAARPAIDQNRDGGTAEGGGSAG